MADFFGDNLATKTGRGQNFRWDRIPTGRRMLKCVLQARPFGTTATGWAVFLEYQMPNYFEVKIISKYKHVGSSLGGFINNAKQQPFY